MDVSASWEGASERFMANQSHIGAASVSARGNDRLPLSSGILDIGWSSGTPIVRALVDSGFSIWGIDASPSLLSAYRRALPNMPAVFEPVLHSSFFGRTFVGIVSIGLIFLLDGKGQRMLLARVADILEPGGRFLFTASRQARRWNDTLTGRYRCGWETTDMLPIWPA